MTESDVLSTHQTREEGIQEAIFSAKLAAAEEGELMTITVCLGLGACRPGDVYRCQYCEVITVTPAGIVSRETRAH
jgi:hypothetical protein